MSMRRLALVLALGSAACTEHAPSFGRLSLSDGGTTEPLTGDSSGGGSFPTSNAADDPLTGDTSSSEPGTSTGETTGPAALDTTTDDGTTAAPVNEPLALGLDLDL